MTWALCGHSSQLDTYIRIVWQQGVLLETYTWKTRVIMRLDYVLKIETFIQSLLMDNN